MGGAVLAEPKPGPRRALVAAAGWYRVAPKSEVGVRRGTS